MGEKVLRKKVIVVAKNNKIQERLDAQASNYNRMYVSVDKITQEISVNLPKDQTMFLFQSSDSSHGVVVI